jgi:hypothetical protein
MRQRIEAFRPGGIPIEDHLGEVGPFQVGVLEVHIPPVRAKAPDTVVASGFSCRHQIRHFTGVEAVHPAVLLRSLLEGLPGKLPRPPGSTEVSRR